MRVHLIGIGGISMRGLAQYYRSAGHTVTGCDLHPPRLRGIKTVVGHAPDHIGGADLVVYTSAIAHDSPGGREVAAARTAGIKVQKRARAIGAITRERPTIAVSGMHGKSTTTGMLAHILAAAAKDPLVLIGAPLPDADGATFRAGRGPFVLEADEFDRSFLAFSPDIAILTNIEAEHLDYYTGGLPEIVATFAEFLERIKPGGAVIANGDDQNVADVLKRLAISDKRLGIITFGRGKKNDYRITNSVIKEGVNSFQIRVQSIIGNQRFALRDSLFALSIPGLHNQMNAAAALAAADRLGVPRAISRSGLADFPGVGQRFELLGQRRGVTYVVDYAHHPTEIAATLAAARAWYPKRRLVAVFQPHQRSRTKLLFNDFVAVLAGADALIVTDIFAVAGRDRSVAVTAGELARAVRSGVGSDARYAPVTRLGRAIAHLVRSGDLMLLLGAGRDITRLAQNLKKSLSAVGRP